jgi:hypothetical protein
VTLLDAAATVAPTADTDAERACCCYAQAVIERWAGLPPATGTLLAMWRIFEGQGPWSPVHAAVQAGVSEQLAVLSHLGPVPERWHLVQGWRGTPFAPGVTGHTFLWRASTATHGWQLDSVIGRGPDMRPRAWADVVREFKGGLAIAVLRRP